MDRIVEVWSRWCSCAGCRKRLCPEWKPRCELSASIKHSATPLEAAIFLPDSKAILHDPQWGVIPGVINLLPACIMHNLVNLGNGRPYFLHLIESASRCDKSPPLCLSGEIKNICLVALYIQDPGSSRLEAETHYFHFRRMFFLLHTDLLKCTIVQYEGKYASMFWFLLETLRFEASWDFAICPPHHANMLMCIT